MELENHSRLLRFLEDRKVITVLARVEGIAEDPMCFLHSNSHEARRNFLACLQWYKNLPEGQKDRHPDISKTLQGLLDALVGTLQRGITRNSAEATDRLMRLHTKPLRMHAGEIAYLIMKADPNISFLGRPARSYQGVPAELVAWVLGVDAEDFYRFRRELSETERSNWHFSLSLNVMDYLTGWYRAVQSFVNWEETLRLRKNKETSLTKQSTSRALPKICRISDETKQRILEGLKRDNNERTQ